jgi:hypothetical protein
VKEATKVILHDVAGKDLQECLQQSYGPWQKCDSDRELLLRQRCPGVLTEHQVIKVYCGSEGIAPCILWPWH